MFNFFTYFCCKRRIKNMFLYNKMKKYGNIFNYTKFDYDYELADNFRDFETIVPFTQRGFWVCSGIKLLEPDDEYFDSSPEDRAHFDNVYGETLLLHIKSNLVFNISGELIGRLKIIEDSGTPYIVSTENMDQRFVEWFNKCKELTDSKVV